MITARRSLKNSCRSLRTIATKRDESHQSRRLLPVSVRNTDLERRAAAADAGDARLQPVERVVGDHPAVVDDDDAIGEALDFFHVVRRVEQRLAAPLQRLEVVEDRVAALRIDADRRLVEQQDVGIVQQAGGEIEPPLHAAAERLDAIARAIGEADELERRRDRLVERGARQAVERAEEAQVVRAPTARRRARDPAARGRCAASSDRCRPPSRCAVDQHLAALRRQQPGDHRHRRRLAGAVRAEQADELPARRPRTTRRRRRRASRTTCAGVDVKHVLDRL